MLKVYMVNVQVRRNAECDTTLGRTTIGKEC